MRAARNLRNQIIATSKRLFERGWVANHDGNLTARLSDNCFLATPTATSKGDVSDSLLIEVDGKGKRVSGTARPFGEFALHMAIYERRSDVKAVIHAHPPHATAIACSSQNPIEQPFIAEAIVSIGARIPKVPFAAPGPEARRALAGVVDDVDAALLENHGVFAWGRDLEQAYLRLELVEHLARIAILALPLGGVQPLPADVIAPLLKKRAGAGLGKAADRALEQTRLEQTRRLEGRQRGQSVGPSSGSSSDLAQLVREEILRAVKKHG